jgi:hypothetical protein
MEANPSPGYDPLNTSSRSTGDPLPPRKFADLFRLPFVRVRSEDVARRAYFHWENRSGRRWDDEGSNWLQAELEQMTAIANEELDSFVVTDRNDLGDRTFGDLYALVDADWAPRPQGTHVMVRGSRDPRRCAFCRRGLAEGAKFKLEAHIIPQLLGSNRVISYDECDDCNQRHGRTLEDALGKMLLQDRAFGRAARAKVSLGRGRSSVSSPGKGGTLRIELVDGDASVNVSRSDSHTMEIVAPNQSYSPMDAIKAIAKSGLLLLPDDRRVDLDHVRRWIRGEVQYESLPVVRAFIPGPYPFATTGIAVWSRERNETDATRSRLPSHVVMLWTGSSAVVWSPPDADGSQVGPVILPPIPKPRVPGETRIGAYTVRDGRLNRPRPSTWSMHITGRVLRYSRDPEPIRITSEDERGEFSIDSILTTGPEDDSASDVTYTITGQQIVGTIKLWWEPPAGKARFEYADPTAAPSENPVGLRFLMAVRKGAPFRIDQAAGAADTLLSWPRIMYEEK